MDESIRYNSVEPVTDLGVIMESQDAKEVGPNRVKRVMKIGKRAVEGAVAFFVLSPTNEISRVAATGAVLAATNDAYLAAATFGGTTLVIESASGVVAADLIDSEGGKKFIDKVNNRLGKMGVNENAKLNSVTKAGISYMAGSGVATFVEHREDPSRTRSQNVRYGLKNAGALGAVCTAQGWLIAKGIADPDPLTVGGAVAAVGAFAAAGKWVSSRVRK